MFCFTNKIKKIGLLGINSNVFEIRTKKLKEISLKICFVRIYDLR